MYVVASIITVGVGRYGVHMYNLQRGSCLDVPLWKKKYYTTRSFDCFLTPSSTTTQQLAPCAWRLA